MPCAQLKGLTKLTFLDGTQVRVTGLDQILADIYAEGEQVNLDTAEEIVNRLEKKNYIPTSARGEYQQLLLNEYRKYVASKRDNIPT
jgi:HEPN domain-containing protein